MNLCCLIPLDSVPNQGVFWKSGTVILFVFKHVEGCQRPLLLQALKERTSLFSATPQVAIFVPRPPLTNQPFFVKSFWFHLADIPSPLLGADLLVTSEFHSLFCKNDKKITGHTTNANSVVTYLRCIQYPAN